MMSLLALGLCVMVAWVAVRVARPRKLFLRGAPGRPNSVNVLHVVGVFALHVICMLAFQQALAMLAGVQDGEPPMTVQLPSWMFAQLVMAGASAAVAGTCFRHGLRRGAGLSLRRWRIDIGRAVVGFLVTIPPVLLTMFLSIHIFQALKPEWFREHAILTFLRTAPLAWRAAAVATAVVLAPLAEELFFRGLVQSMLKRYFGGRAWPAVIVTSLLFAISHLNEPQAIPSLFLLSLGLGYNYERTGRLASPIFMHAIFNAVMIYLSPG